MRIKLDENLSERLQTVLEDLGHDTDTVVSEELSGSHDDNVLRAAGLADRLLFTLDTGFLDLKHYPPGSHKGIVVFRPPTQGALTVIRFVSAFVRSANLRKHARHTTIVERTRTRIFK